jgi:hypothetical protein
MRNVLKSLSGALLAAGLVLAVPAVSSAQAPPRQPNPNAEARKQITAAQQQVNELKKQQAQVKEKLTATFASKEEFKNTVANHKKAKAAWEAARKQAMTAAQAKPEYKQLVKDREALQTKYNDAQAKSDAEGMRKTGTDLASKGVLIKNMEKDAMEQDDKAIAAKEAFEAAEKEMKALDDEVEAALQTDPDYMQLQQQVTQGEQQLQSQKDALAQQQKSEAQARSAASKAASESKRASSKAPKGAPRGRSGGGGY